MKDPAFLFYPADFLSGVSDLTMEERGQYITLLCLQQQKGTISEKIIGLSVGSVSSDVMEKFVLDENGDYYNVRLRQEIEKRAKHIDKQRDNGKKGGRPKNQNKTQPITQIEPISKPKQKPLGNENRNRIENINEDIIEIEKEGTGEKTVFEHTFESFRKSYPGTKRGFEIEFKILQKHADWKNEVLKLPVALERQQHWRRQAKQHGAFVPSWPMLQTWLNQRRWEEELNFNFQEQNGTGTNQASRRGNALTDDYLADLRRRAMSRD